MSAVKQQTKQIPLPPIEEVAQAILDISAAMKKLNGTRLRQEAIITLLYAQCKGHVNKSQILLVVNEVSRMDQAWLKPLEKKS